MGILLDRHRLEWFRIVQPFLPYDTAANAKVEKILLCLIIHQIDTYSLEDQLKQ